MTAIPDAAIEAAAKAAWEAIPEHGPWEGVSAQEWADARVQVRAALTAALRSVQVPDEWEYGVEARFVASGEVHDYITAPSLDDAKSLAATLNDDEPRPNIFDGDDIEVTFGVVRRKPRVVLSDDDWEPFNG